MDFGKIKEEFKIYLENKNAEKGTNKKSSISSNDDMSIFTNSSEFKKYLSEEYDLDASIMTKSINDILGMDIVNGKLVDLDALEDAEDMENGFFEFDFPSTEGASETSDDSAEETNVETSGEASGETKNVKGSITDVINALFSDKDVQKVMDVDEDGKLSSDEIKDFVGTVAGLDGTEDDVSLEDLFTAADLIKEGRWLEYAKSSDEEKAVETKDETVQTQAPAASSGSSGASGASGVSSGGGSYSGSGVSGSSGSSGSTSATTNKTLDNMDEAELQSELQTRESELSDKQTELSDAVSGNTSELKSMQEKIDDAYDKYLEELEKVDEDLAEEMDAKKQEIDDQKQKIADKENEISDAECAVSDAKTAVSTAESSVSAIESAIASISTEGLSDEQKAKVESRKAELQTQLSAAQEAKADAEKSLEEAEEKLETAKEEKAELEEGLETLNSEMEEIEAKILEAAPEMKEYMEDYKEAQQDFDTAKADAISKAQESVKVAQDAVNEVQEKIVELQNKSIKSGTGEYNAEAGKKLANNALDVPGTTGLCLGGVSDTLAKTYGVGLPGLGSAYKAAEALRGNTPGYEEIASHFVEDTTVTKDQLPNLPAGSIIVWENNGPGNLSQEHGHISISLGDGRESSDHIQSQIVCDRNFTVFYPID